MSQREQVTCQGLSLASPPARGGPAGEPSRETAEGRRSQLSPGPLTGTRVQAGSFYHLPDRHALAVMPSAAGDRQALTGLWLGGRKTGTFQEADLAAGLKTKGGSLTLASEIPLVGTYPMDVIFTKAERHKSKGVIKTFFFTASNQRPSESIAMEQECGTGATAAWGEAAGPEGRNVQRNPRQAISGKASDRTECMVPSVCMEMGVEGGGGLELSGRGNSGHLWGL